MTPVPNDGPAPGPLAGVRIADLTTVVMGPLGTRMLGDMGADVIRVEAPDGDVIRHYKPLRSPAMSAFSINLNRNKRSIVLDLKSPEGRQAVLALLATCDVFVTNMRRSALERLGLTEAHVREVRPDIIYCVANGYDSDGPKADHAAYDDVIQAASGVSDMFSWFGGEPQLMPTILADKVTGVHVAFAIAAALHGRAVTGQGSTLEVPMAETMAAFNLVEHLGGHAFEPRESFSYSRIMTPYRKPRRTSDGWIVLLPYSRDNWEAFWTHGGRPEFVGDPRFATAAARVEHADTLYSLMDDVVQHRTTADWLQYCEEHSIPCAEVLDLRTIADDPHFSAVELLKESQHPTEGAYRYARDPIKVDGQHTPLRHHAPRLGQDTEAILAELDLDQAVVAKLLESLDPDSR